MKWRSRPLMGRRRIALALALVLCAVCRAGDRTLDGSANYWQFGATGSSQQDEYILSLLSQQNAANAQQPGPVGIPPRIENAGIDEETLRVITLASFHQGTRQPRHDLPQGLPHHIHGFGRKTLVSRQKAAVREIVDGIDSMHITNGFNTTFQRVPLMPLKGQPVHRLNRDDEVGDFGDESTVSRVGSIDAKMFQGFEEGLVEPTRALQHKSRTPTDEMLKSALSVSVADHSPRKSRRVEKSGTSTSVRSQSVGAEISGTANLLAEDDTLVLRAVPEVLQTDGPSGAVRIDPASEEAQRKRIEAVLALRRKLYGPAGIVPDEVGRALAGYVSGGRSKDPLVSLVRRLLHARKGRSLEQIHALSAPSSLSVAEITRSRSPVVSPTLGYSYTLNHVYRSRASAEEEVPIDVALDVCRVLGVSESELGRLVDQAQSSITVRDVVATVSRTRNVAISPVLHGSSTASCFGEVVDVILHGQWFTAQSPRLLSRSLRADEIGTYDSMQPDYQERLERLHAHSDTSLAIVERLYMHAMLTSPHVALLLSHSQSLQTEAFETYIDVPRRPDSEPDWLLFVESQWAPRRRAMTPVRGILAGSNRSRSLSRVLSADSVSRDETFRNCGQSFVFSGSPFSMSSMSVGVNAAPFGNGGASMIQNTMSFATGTAHHGATGPPFIMSSQSMGSFFFCQSPSKMQSPLFPGMGLHHRPSPQDIGEGRGMPLVFSFNSDVFSPTEHSNNGRVSSRLVDTIHECTSEHSSDQGMDVISAKADLSVSQPLIEEDRRLLALQDVSPPREVSLFWESLEQTLSPSGADPADERRIGKRARRFLKSADAEILRSFMRDSLLRDALVFQRQLAAAVPLDSPEAHIVQGILSAHAACLSEDDVRAVADMLTAGGEAHTLVLTIADHIGGAHSMASTQLGDLIEMVSIVAAQRITGSGSD